MALSEQDVEHVATLARLELTLEERETFTRQLAQILAYVEQLNELDTKGVEPLSHVLPLANVFREDEIIPPAPPERMLGLAPQSEKGHYKVPRIIAQSPE